MVLRQSNAQSGKELVEGDELLLGGDDAPRDLEARLGRERRRQPAHEAVVLARQSVWIAVSAMFSFARMSPATTAFGGVAASAPSSSTAGAAAASPRAPARGR